MELVAGFMGVVQDPATLALRPITGWVVRESQPDAGLLAAAAELGDAEAVISLLAARADANVRFNHCDEWRTPLMLAIHSFREENVHQNSIEEQLRCVRILTDHSVKIGSDDLGEAAVLCLQVGRLRCFHAIVESSGGQLILPKHALHACLNVETAVAALKLGADMSCEDGNGHTPRQAAFHFFDMDLYRLLAFIELSDDRMEQLKLWPARAAQLAKEDKLRNAASRGNVAEVEELLKEVNPSTCDVYGFPAIACAVRHGHEACAVALLRADARMQWMDTLPDEVAEAEADSEDECLEPHTPTQSMQDRNKAPMTFKTSHPRSVLDQPSWGDARILVGLRCALLLAHLSESKEERQRLLNERLEELKAAVLPLIDDGTASIPAVPPKAAQMACRGLKLTDSAWQRVFKVEPQLTYDLLSLN